MENHLLVEMDEEYSPIARLVELGRQKKYVTIDDILQFLPEAEKDVEQLEEAFSALLSAGIASLKTRLPVEVPEDEFGGRGRSRGPGPAPELVPDDYLANIDTTDSIGLYLKEVSQVALLTAKEEVDLAQRIERGRTAREELARGQAAPGRRIELRKSIEDGWLAREHLIHRQLRW